MRIPLLFVTLLMFLNFGCSNKTTEPDSKSKRTSFEDLSQLYDIIIYITTDSSFPFETISADITRNGNESTVSCSDNGGNDYDQPKDGTYVCISKGGYAMYLNVHITAVTANKKTLSLFSGLLRTNDLSQNNFSFHLTKGLNRFILLRTANSSSEGAYSMKDQVWRFILVTWGLLLFLYFGILWLQKKS
jgi:hypothetical protein